MGPGQAPGYVAGISCWFMVRCEGVSGQAHGRAGLGTGIRMGTAGPGGGWREVLDAGQHEALAAA